MKQRHIAMLLSALLLTGCGSGYSRQTADLTAQFKSAEPAEGIGNAAEFAAAQYQFTLSMLQTSVRMHPEENQSLSPYLAAQTLMLAANGAAGETRAEIEALFGGMATDTLNDYLAGWRRSQPSEQLVTAHSAWFRADAGLDVQQDYLQALHTYYDAEAFTAAFDDSTLADMNLWVEKCTNGKITQCIEQIQPDAVFDLMSAAVFDAQWESPYADNETYDGLFYAADGTQQTVSYMAKTEQAVYLSDENAVGLLRNYADRRYAFAALMPTELTVPKYLEQLTAEALQTALGTQMHTMIDGAIPAFSTERTLDLKPLLNEMGVQTAFAADSADFSALTAQPVYLERAVQQSAVQVDRHGTAATYSIDLSGADTEPDAKFVRLTKPFVWFIYDRQYGIPVMAGTMMTPN